MAKMAASNPNPGTAARATAAHTAPERTTPERTANARPAKSERIEVRATERQESVIRQAATATERTVTEFILASAVEQAERVLADRRWFVASEDQYEEFLRLLDEPLPSTDTFEKLWSRPSPFGRAFTPAPR